MLQKISEEGKVLMAENLDNDENIAVLKAYNRIPYALINQEVDNSTSDYIQQEMGQICKYYKVYNKGISFVLEGSNGDYVPAKLKYKMCASLINKEARFLFAESPDVRVESKDSIDKVSEEAKDQITLWNSLLNSVLDQNLFEKILIQAARDCFIGKRVACLINFNEEDGITVTFLPSTQFIFENRIGNENVLTKFVCFVIVKDSTNSVDKRILKKKYTLEGDVVYLEEQMYDGSGRIVKDEYEGIEKQATKLKTIPAVVFLNDGLLGDYDGESEIEVLMDYEKYYSKLANADIDAERKTMNPTRYTIDMEPNSTKNLSSSAGSYWDLQSDQNLESPKPGVGMLESSMNYSDALKISLDRIKTTGYEQVDMPNITLETMVGAITSGKALKAIYWPLIVRCKEKMKMWGPKLRTVVEIIFEGALAYPNTTTRYIDVPITPIAHKIIVDQNTPLPEDENEERNMDLAEVAAQTMSRKSYMQKWRGLTDDKVMEELQQIALENQILEESTIIPDTTSNAGATKQLVDEEQEMLEQDDLEQTADNTIGNINGYED